MGRMLRASSRMSDKIGLKLTCAKGCSLPTSPDSEEYLARVKDPPAGNRVVCRVLSRSTDIHFGFLLAAKDADNRKQRLTLTERLSFQQVKRYSVSRSLSKEVIQAIVFCLSFSWT